MKLATALLAAIFMFSIGFVLGGLFIMPHVLPPPNRVIHWFENEYWIYNWPGVFVGLILAVPSFRATIRTRRRAKRDAVN